MPGNRTGNVEVPTSSPNSRVASTPSPPSTLTGSMTTRAQELKQPPTTNADQSEGQEDEPDDGIGTRASRATGQR